MNSVCSGDKYSRTSIKGVPSFLMDAFFLTGDKCKQNYTESSVPTGLLTLPAPNAGFF